MDAVWLAPAALAAVVLVGVAALARGVSLEASALQRDMRGFGEQRLALVEVRDTSREMLAAARARRLPR